MEELIKLFNDKKTHIEVEAVNQKDNGTTDDKNVYSYTVMLIESETKEVVESVSIGSFNKSEIEFATGFFNHARLSVK